MENAVKSIKTCQMEPTLELKSKLKLFGHMVYKFKGFQQANHHSKQDLIQDFIDNLLKRKLNSPQFQPIKIHIKSNTIAIIDCNNKAWLILDCAYDPICLSDMIRMKAHNIDLAYNQLIVHCKDQHILVNWGHKKYFQSEELQTIDINTLNKKHKYAHLFEFYRIKNTNRSDFFEFASITRSLDVNLLYKVTSNSIIAYPKISKLQLKTKIIGLSIGKYHKLCWDQEGHLFSWGYRSFALGHTQLPEQQIVEQPTIVSSIKSPVVKALALINYSLALTIDGFIYQWGIKRHYPDGEETVYQPRIVQIENQEKIIDLKGRVDRFGVLTLTKKLYVWGKDIKSDFSENSEQRLEDEEFYNTPTLFKHNNVKQILDFQISQYFVAIIYSEQQKAKFSEASKRYWNHLKLRVKDTLHPSYKAFKTEQSQNSKEKGKLFTSNSGSLRKNTNPLELALYLHKSKEQYLSSAIQYDKIVNYVMEPNIRKSQNIQYEQRVKTVEDEHNSNRKNKVISQKVQMTSTMYKIPAKTANQFAHLLSESKLFKQAFQKKPLKMKKIQIKQKLFSRDIKSYDEKRKQALDRKLMLETQYKERALKNMETLSYEYRMQKRRANQQIKKQAKDIQLCKNSVQKTLIKAFIVKLLSKSPLIGRQIKINNFARHLQLERLQKNIRSLFVKTRVKLKLKSLRNQQIFRFFFLTVVFRRYFKKFRQEKRNRHTKSVVQQVMKHVLKDKIRAGTLICSIEVKKLQKINEWIIMVKKQRVKCLKMMWKSFLVKIMKPSANTEKAIFNFKNVEQYSFAQIYQQRSLFNPLLKLKNYLQAKSIFGIKKQYFQDIKDMFTNSEKVKKDVSRVSYAKKRTRLKFFNTQEDSHDKNYSSNDIYPYSMHYNFLIHPRQLDLAIPQSMKLNEKWIKIQKKTLQKYLRLVIFQHEKKYRVLRKKYDVQVATYIKKNYDFFAQKRWKYILQFNKIQTTKIKEKKMRDLNRLMSLIGAQKILEQDCIPEKQRILDEIEQVTDSPQLPTPYIIFRYQQFRSIFKQYYDELYEKANQLRRQFF